MKQRFRFILNVASWWIPSNKNVTNENGFDVFHVLVASAIGMRTQLIIEFGSFSLEKNNDKLFLPFFFYTQVQKVFTKFSITSGFIWKQWLIQKFRSLFVSYNLQTDLPPMHCTFRMRTTTRDTMSLNTKRPIQASKSHDPIVCENPFLTSLNTSCNVLEESERAEVSILSIVYLLWNSNYPPTIRSRVFLVSQPVQSHQDSPPFGSQNQPSPIFLL